MGLFDQIAGSVLGGNNAETHSGLLNVVTELIQQQGGVGALVQKFQEHGLSEMVGSWVSTGANQAISPEQIQHVLGGSKIGEIAGSLGISSEQVSSGLAQVLPQLVDQMTPNGAVPDAGNALQSVLGQLTGKLGR